MPTMLDYLTDAEKIALCGRPPAEVFAAASAAYQRSTRSGTMRFSAAATDPLAAFTRECDAAVARMNAGREASAAAHREMMSSMARAKAAIKADEQRQVRAWAEAALTNLANENRGTPAFRPAPARKQ